MINFPDTLMNGVFTHIWLKYTIHWASGLYRCSHPLWNMARLGMYVSFEGFSSGNYPESYLNWVHPGWRYVCYRDFFWWFGSTIKFVWGTCNPRYLRWADPNWKANLFPLKVVSFLRGERLSSFLGRYGLVRTQKKTKGEFTLKALQKNPLLGCPRKLLNGLWPQFIPFFK